MGCATFLLPLADPRVPVSARADSNRTDLEFVLAARGAVENAQLQLALMSEPLPAIARNGRVLRRHGERVHRKDRDVAHLQYTVVCIMHSTEHYLVHNIYRARFMTYIARASPSWCASMRCRVHAQPTAHVRRTVPMCSKETRYSRRSITGLAPAASSSSGGS